MLKRLSAAIPLAALAATLAVSGAQAEQNLTCDLTFGDMQTNVARPGQLVVRVDGASASGELRASERIATIAGYWGRDRVDLRILGSDYAGYLHPTVVDNEVVYRLAGRAGENWAGFWYGDCRPAAAPSGRQADAAGNTVLATGEIEWRRGTYLDLETGAAGPVSDDADLVYTAGTLPALGPVLSARFTRIAAGWTVDAAFTPLLSERCLAAVDGMRQDSLRVSALREGDLFCALTGDSQVSMFLVTELPRAVGLPIRLHYATWQGELN
jgi:hypothetical protein